MSVLVYLISDTTDPFLLGSDFMYDQCIVDYEQAMLHNPKASVPVNIVLTNLLPATEWYAY